MMSKYGAPSFNPNQAFERRLELRLGGKAFDVPYGAPHGLSIRLPCCFRINHSIFRSNRKQLNGVAIIVSALVPWVIFCLVYALVSFYVHYQTPITCWVCVVALFLVSVGTCGVLFQLARIRRERETEAEREPMWYGFLCATCFIGVVAGVVLGSRIFGPMCEVYDFQNLATYHNVDPSHYVGQQLVDAGRVQFSARSHLDIGKSMGFKNVDIYCVAPIVSPETTPQTYLDFWAIGKNCCSGVTSDFHCDGYNNSLARGGLRLLDDASRPFYRLAVQQAEATYNIRSHKPLFFVWGEDPVRHTNGLQHNAYQTYILGVSAAFCVQLFLVVTASLVFAKIFPMR